MTSLQWCLLGAGLVVACVGAVFGACERRRLRCCQPRPPGVDRRKKPREQSSQHNGESRA